MAEKIIAAFESGNPLKMPRMSWQEFLNMLEGLSKYRTQTCLGLPHERG